MTSYKTQKRNGASREGGNDGKKELLTNEEHSEMITELMLIDSPQQAREFHKKYKKYGHGLPIRDRYPDLITFLKWLPSLISVIALAISIAVYLRR